MTISMALGWNGFFICRWTSAHSILMLNISFSKYSPTLFLISAMNLTNIIVYCFLVDFSRFLNPKLWLLFPVNLVYIHRWVHAQSLKIFNPIFFTHLFTKFACTFLIWWICAEILRVLAQNAYLYLNLVFQFKYKNVVFIRDSRIYAAKL